MAATSKPKSHLEVTSLKLTAKAPENRPKQSYSNHPVFQVLCYVNFREGKWRCEVSEKLVHRFCSSTVHEKNLGKVTNLTHIKWQNLDLLFEIRRLDSSFLEINIHIP